jgi:hypothetical protein
VCPEHFQFFLNGDNLEPYAHRFQGFAVFVELSAHRHIDGSFSVGKIPRTVTTCRFGKMIDCLPKKLNHFVFL